MTKFSLPELVVIVVIFKMCEVPLRNLINSMSSVTHFLSELGIWKQILEFSLSET